MIAARIGSLALMAAVALGLAAPVSLVAQDNRLVEILYDADNVVRIDGRAKVQATIRFDDAERIENVAIGDSNAWQVTPNKRANLLFVKPLSPSAATNMTVVTNLRTYFFDLVASPRNRPVYIVKFTYPEPIIPEGILLPANEGANDLEMEAATDPFAVVDPAALNFEWERDGDRDLFPARIYDDGTATFLLWPEGEKVPAILISDPEGVEGPVNFTVRGDKVVIDGVPAQIILRSGKDAATLTYAGPVSANSALARDGSLASKDDNRRRKRKGR